MIGTSKSVWGFDPRSVPGCQLWLDPTNSSSLTLSGANVLTISDSSTTGATATRIAGNSYATTTTISGNRILSFPGANAIYRSSMVLTGAAYTIFTISSLLSTSGEAFGFQRIVNSSGSGGWIFIGANYGNLATFSGTGGTWNDININSPTYTLLGGGLQLVSMVVSGSSLIPYINGTSMDAKTGTTGAITTLDIGGWQENNTQHWNGYIGDIIVYNSALTTSQRQQVEGYLAHKWGLVPYYDSTTPLSIPGCQLWLDGADPSGTGTPPANGTILSTWVDKSGNGRNTTATGTGPTYTTNIFNGYSAPVFNGTTMTTPSYLITTDSKLSIFMLCKKTGSRQTGENSGLIGIAAGYQYFYLYIRTSVTNYLEIIYQLTVAELTNYSISDGTTLLMTILTNGLSISGYLGGTSVFNTSVSNNGYSMNNLTSRWNIGEGQFVGPICEIIIFNSTFTNAQRQTIEGYLAKKWGIGSSSIPSTHPFYSIRPHLRTFQPIDVPGCQLWLDAADQNVMTLSGSTVTQWKDKSGNVKNTTSYAGTPTLNASAINGRQAITLNGSSSFTGSITGSGNTLTVCIVGIQGSGCATSGGLLCFGRPGYSDWQDPGSFTIEEGQLSGSMFSTRASLSTQRTTTGVNTPFIYILIFDGTYANTYTNGTFQSSTSSSGSFAYTEYKIGTRAGNTQNVFWTGFIGEALVYNSALTTSERQQVEGYLAHKWGLSLYLPVISPLTIPGCQLWFDAADTSSMTFSGSTITQWNDKSGNGRNATIASGRIGAVYSTALNAVNFATSNTGYITNYSASPTNETMFVVFNNPSPTNYNFILIGGVSGARSLAAGFTNTGSGTVGNLNTQVAWLVSTGGYTLGTTALVTSQFTTSTNSISLNGGTTATGGAPGFTAGRVTYLGVDATNPIFYYVGYAMEILFYNSILTSAQRQQVEGYLARKWGISISATLPSPHSFKSFPPASIPSLPAAIESVTLTSLSTSGGTINWTSTNATGYRWYVGTGAGSGQVASGIITSGSILTTTVTYTFVSGTLYYAWVIPYNLDGLGPTTISPSTSIGAASATGGTIVSSGGFTYHVFTSSGSLVVTGVTSMNYLVVGGGGGGGDRHGGGGGGGGVLSGTWSTSTTTYTVTVGVGGIHGATSEDGQIPYGSPNGAGSKGGDSALSGTGISITAYGGGGGGTYDGNPTGTVGSGGGGGGQNLSGVAGTAGQGNAGGAGLLPGAGGGGGAGGAGVAANTGTGGIGTSSFSTHLLAAGYGTTFAVPTSPNIVISGGVAYIAGGGGGCAGTSPGPGGSGGLGGGGRGDWTDSFISAGTPNTGGGGGGTRSDLGLLYSIGRDGGSGLVLVWY